jgi:hypothetical protein
MKDENMLLNFERRILKEFMTQLWKMVYGDQGITMNYINYIMNQIQ